MALEVSRHPTIRGQDNKRPRQVGCRKTQDIVQASIKEKADLISIDAFAIRETIFCGIEKDTGLAYIMGRPCLSRDEHLVQNVLVRHFVICHPVRIVKETRPGVLKKIIQFTQLHLQIKVFAEDLKKCQIAPAVFWVVQT